MLYEMCQISKIIQHSYNLQQYGQMWQNFLLFYILFLSPLPSFFLFSSLSLFGFFSSPSNPNPLLSNLSLSLCLPLPISLSAVALLDLGASVLTKALTFAANICRSVLRLRRFDLVAHRARFLLRACFQHDRVDRLGQGDDRAWVGVVDCWGDL